MHNKRLFVLLLLLSLFLAGCTGKDQQKIYTVTYDSDGGSTISSSSVVEGERAARPADPVKEGYTFVEWRLNGTPYDFSKPVNADITLKAFYTDAGSTIPDNGNSNSNNNKPEPENTRIPCTGISTQYSAYWSMEGNGKWNLNITLTPANTTDKMTLTSEDENVVKVDNDGNVYTGSPGNTKIHIKCGDVERVIGFETRPKTVKAETLTLDKTLITAYFGTDYFVSATVTPAHVTNKVKFTSSDESVATVTDQGIIKVKGYGQTIITVSIDDLVKTCVVNVEGETVIFEMENNVSVKAGSGAKIPYKATHIASYDGNVSKTDVTLWVDFHIAYTSALDIDGNGNVYAKGAVYDTVDIPVYFTYSDGSSFSVTSPTFIVHVEK